MKWKKFTINTTIEAEDIISLMLNELGVGGVEIDDNMMISDEDIANQFIDILPEMGEFDGSARVSFFIHLEDENEKALDGATGNDVNGAGAGETHAKAVDDSYTINDRIWKDEEVEQLITDIRANLEEMRAYTDIGEGTIEIGETEETDWRDNWKEFFKPILIDNVLIIPSWLEVPVEYEGMELKKIVIDPGTAFGTGGHETTRLCIPMIKKYCRDGMKVLDIGTGSGILAMAASRLGAGEVIAVDVDPGCEAVVNENLEKNEITNVAAFTCNVLESEEELSRVREQGPYDIVVANILAPVIKALSEPGVVDTLIKKDGRFITSGIMDIYEDEVKQVMAANPSWGDIEVIRENEWVCITAKRI
ncbi:MAG: 50S ribosomal protein L11 methyltransferase [Eubacteriales bacterium]|nr:50S ribosomal protein L11 methyltransferase [Eubacteriales bacterium]